MSMLTRIALAMLLCSLAHRAAAEDLELMGVRIALPFAWERAESAQSMRQRNGVEVAESQRITLRDGPNAGQELLVIARYWMPRRIDDATLARVLHEIAEEERARKGVRDVGEVRIGTYQFVFQDGRVENTHAHWPEQMSLNGNVGSALLSVDVFAKDAKLLTPELEGALKTLSMDFEKLLRTKGRFDKEAASASSESVMETPLGRIDLGKGGMSGLYSSTARFDAQGRQLSRERTYVAKRDGFFKMLVPITLGFVCMADTDENYEDLVSLYDDDDSLSIKERTVAAGVREPARFLGGQGVLARGKGPEMMMGARPAVERTVLRKDGTMYAFTVVRDGGARLADDVLAKLQVASPQCRTDLPLDPPPGAAPRPTPAAGNDAAPRVSSL